MSHLIQHALIIYVPNFIKFKELSILGLKWANDDRWQIFNF